MLVRNIKQENLIEINAYINNSYVGGSKQWITLFVTNKNGEMISQYHYKKNELLKAIDGVYKANGTDINIYTSQNTFYYPKRSNNTIRSIQKLYCDLDIYKNDVTVDKALYILYTEYIKYSIPEPSRIIYTGRGLRLEWNIEKVPSMALPLFNVVQKYITSTLNELGADSKCIDGARVMRLPGTINTKTGEVCKVLEENDITYELREIQENFLPEMNKKSGSSKKKVKTNNVKYINNIHTLNYNRMLDLEKLCQLRKYDIEGHREEILFLYRYYNLLVCGDKEKAIENTFKLNESLLEPLSSKEVVSATKSAETCYSAIDKHYNYNNTTLIELLDIDPEEQKHLKTIISKKEKYRRDNAKRKQESLDNNGLTKAKRERLEKALQIKKLRALGKTIKEVSEELKISLATVKRLQKEDTSILEVQRIESLEEENKASNSKLEPFELALEEVASCIEAIDTG